MARFSGWRFKLLAQLGAPPTKANLRALDAWQRAEGGSASFNPLNTTQRAPGATAYNSVGVRNFRSPQQGLQATVETLRNGRYGAIVDLLRSGRASAEQIGQAVEASPWGTGGGVLRVLGAGPGPSTAGPGPAKSSSSDFSGGDGRREFVQSLISSIGKHDTKSSVEALTKLRRQQAMSAFAPAPAGAAGPAGVSRDGGAGDPGLEELFYDPLGAIKNGQSIAAIGGHTDHLHYANDNPQAVLAAIAYARKHGISATENPYVDRVDPVHVSGSYHYRDFKGRYGGRKLGEGTDYSASPDKLRRFYRWLAANYR